MKMKELLILQIIGILLFAVLSAFLELQGIFNLRSEITVYTVLAVGNVFNARNQLIKPIEEISTYDKLTGCYNRTMLSSKIKEYENYKEYSVIFFDVNNLKKANDVHGHEVGDRILTEASNQLRVWRKYGDLYRTGGDEFIVVAPNTGEDKLKKTLEQWYSSLEPLNKGYKDDFTCGFSYGISCKSADSRASFEEVMNMADEKMYEMKKELKAQRE